MATINHSGQLASLDLLIMLLSLFLALGMVSGFSEFNFISLKETADRSSLHSIAENAFTIMLSNSPVSCRLEDQTIIPDCIVDFGLTAVTASDLHLPPEIDFNITGLNNLTLPNNPIPKNSGYIELQKNILVVSFNPKSSPDFLEKKWAECYSGSPSCASSGIESRKINLKVWVK